MLRSSRNIAREPGDETTSDDETRSTDDRLLAAAERLTEGAEVDWQELAESCPERRSAVASLRILARLLEGLDDATDSVGDAEVEVTPNAPGPSQPGPLFRWGHLEVLERIGSGGFGEVFRAWDPVLQREVALKLRREDGPTRRNRLYIDEARRLARVRHPNVLAVHGADVHDDRVGLWADFLTGRTLEDILQEEAPLPHERALFITRQAAEALEAVHDAGLVHGDIKASNLMLDESGRAILMDFGAGRDQGEGPADRAQFGSPLSMAPELFDGAPTSPATDLYALGVLLYRMLAGTYPLQAETLPGVVDLHRQGARPALPAVKGAPGRRLALLAMSLLAAAPEERPTVAQTVARLDFIRTAPQRRRRRLAIAAIISSLALGMAAAGIGWIGARRSEREAIAARNEAVTVNRFLQDVLSSPQPLESGRQVRVVDVLERAVERAERNLNDQPWILGRTLAIVGDTYKSLNRYHDAEPLLRRAAELSAEARPHHPQVLIDQANRADVLIDLHRYEEAESILEPLAFSLTSFPDDHRAQVYVRLILSRLAFARGELAETRRLLEEARSQRQEAEWDDDPNRGAVEIDLGRVLAAQGEFQAAEALLRETLAWSLAINGERHGHTLAARVTLSAVLDRLGRSSEAEPLIRRNYEVARQWLGERDPYTVGSLSSVSNNLYSLGRLAESTRLNERALALARQVFGENSEQTLMLMGNQALRLQEMGDSQAAEALYRETIERLEATRSPTHEVVLLNRFNLAELLYEEGRPQEAYELALGTRSRMVQVLGEEHLFTLVNDAVLGASLEAMNRWPEAEALLRETLETETRVLGEDHPQTLETAVYLARGLRRAGREAEAEASLEDVWRRRGVTLGENHPETVAALEQLESWRAGSR